MRFIGDIALDAEVRAIASGAITDGEPVIVNSAGTVSACTDAITGAFGTAVEFESGDTRSGSDSIKGTFDSNSNKVVIGYKDLGNSSYGTAVVATIDPSDNSVSFGTPVVFESAETEYINLAFDSNVNKVVIAYSDLGDSHAGKAIIGTVSSTAISFGSAVTFKARTGSDGVLNNTLVFDSNANKTAVFYVDFADSQKLFCRVISISGTTPSYGTEVEVAQSQYGASSGISGVFDSNSNKVVIFYVDYGDSNKGKARVGTISGTNISFGTAAVFRSGAYSFSGASAFDSTNNKTVNIYRDNDNSQYGTAVVGTVSGTDITFGTPVVYTSHSVNFQGCVYDSSVNRIIVLYRNAAVGDTGNYNVAQVSGTTLTFGTAAIYLNFTTGDTPYGTYDPNAERILLPYRDTQDSNKGKAVVMKTPVAGNLTTENYIGIANAAYADGQKATVKTTGSIARNVPQQPSASNALGSEVVFESAEANWINTTFDSSNNKVVISYQDSGNSNYGTAIVATIDSSDNSITYGSPVVFNSATTSQGKITFDSSNNKVVIAYNNGGDSGHGYAIVGTVSGTNISFGSAAEFENAVISDPAITFDSDENRVVIAYRDEGNSNYGTAIVGTVSGTSISFGSSIRYETANASETAITFDSSNNKIVVMYNDAGNSGYGTAAVGIVNNTEFDGFGTPVVFESASISHISATFDSNSNKVVIAYRDDGNSRHGTAIVGTVSGTSISFGSATVFEGARSEYISATFDSSVKKVVVAYRDDGGDGSDYGTAIVGTVSGTSISFGSAVVFESAATSYVSATFDSNSNRVVIAYRDQGNSNYGTAVAIATAGTLEDLTIGQQYFVQTDGSLGTSADSPSVIAGTAIGASELIVKG